MPVISAFVMESDPTEFDNPVLAFYFDYWHRKRGGRAMPSRSDIQPQELKPHQDWVILLDALPGLNDFRYRLLGTRVIEYFLGDATGSTIRDAYRLANMNKAYTESVILLHRTVCVSRSIIRLKGPSGEWERHFFPEFDALYLPLSDDGIAVNTILTAFTFNYERLKAVRNAD